MEEGIVRDDILGLGIWDLGIERESVVYWYSI